MWLEATLWWIIFDLYHDDGKKVSRIWVLGGRLSPKLGTPEIVIKQ